MNCHHSLHPFININFIYTPVIQATADIYDTVRTHTVQYSSTADVGVHHCYYQGNELIHVKLYDASNMDVKFTIE